MEKALSWENTLVHCCEYHPACEDGRETSRPDDTEEEPTVWVLLNRNALAQLAEEAHDVLCTDKPRQGRANLENFRLNHL